MSNQLINKIYCRLLKNIQLEIEVEVISFDVGSLYTNVPVTEAIDYCAELLYSNRSKSHLCPKIPSFN